MTDKEKIWKYLHNNGFTYNGTFYRPENCNQLGIDEIYKRVTEWFTDDYYKNDWKRGKWVECGGLRFGITNSGKPYIELVPQRLYLKDIKMKV